MRQGWLRYRVDHTLPRFYLERFAKDEQIGTVELPGKRRFRQSIRKAATANDFYLLGDPSHEAADAFEKLLAQLEGSAAEAFRVAMAGTWPLTPSARAVLAEFITVQYLRGPDHRRWMRDFSAQTSRMEISLRGKEWMANTFAERLGRPLTEEELDRLWTQAIQEEGPPIPIAPERHVKQIVALVPKIYRYFVGRPWMLVRFDRRRLLTGDAPVTLIPSQSASSWEGVGLATAWGISFPLSRNVGLLMMDPLPLAEHTTIDAVASGSLDREMSPSTGLARLFNACTIRGARRFVFHHPDDADVVPDDLPDPQMSEIEPLDGDFVEMGERMRAHLAAKQHQRGDDSIGVGDVGQIE